MPSANKLTIVQKVRAFGELTRPMEWTKTLFNMAIALLIAFYVYSAQINGIIFIAGFAAVIALWSGLYTLNDLTDWKLDLAHKSKHVRPIPSGRVKPKEAFWFALVLLFVSFGIAFALNNFLLVLCLGAMLLNQFFYTLKPYRFKERKGLDIISGSLVNPIFRYLSGLVLFVSIGALLSNSFPILPIILIAGLQCGGYLLYRFSSKTLDVKLKMKSTVAKISERRAKAASYFSISVALLSMFAMILNGAFFSVGWLGFFPIQYILIIIPLIIAFLALKGALIDPSKATTGKVYKHIYYSLHATLALIVLVLFLVFIFYP